jgi:hypothetical protein
MDSSCIYKNYMNSMKPGEFYFVLDRSGSMYGFSIETAKKALMLLIRSIPPGSRFNIISFGSEFQGMFSEPAEYTQDTLEYAIDQVKGFDADLGGTEIYQPLENIFSIATISTDLDKHVFLITNGAVFNPQDVVDLIRSYNDEFTVHTFGIGDAANTTLVVECANAGNGSYYFVNEMTEGLQGKVIDALRKSFEPYVKFDNNEIFIEGNKYIEMPVAKCIKNKVFNGDYFTYCAIVNELADEKLKGSVDFSFTRSDNGKEERTVIDFDEHLKILEGDSIFKIISNSYINGKGVEKSKEEIIAISIKYQVPSIFTALFAAEKLEDKIF